MNDLVEPQRNEAAERFTAMAASIEHNPIATFGGAVVIMPPLNGGEPIELLILDLKADPAQFWSTIRTRIDIKLAELDETRRNTTAFGGRR